MWIPCVYRISQHSSLFAFLLLIWYNAHLFLIAPSLWYATVRFVSTNMCHSLWSILFLFLCALSVAVGYPWTYFPGTVLLKECKLSESELFTWKYGNYFSPYTLSFSTSVKSLCTIVIQQLQRTQLLPSTFQNHSEMRQ